MPNIDNGEMFIFYREDENIDDVMRVENSSYNSELAIVLDENGEEVEFLTAFNSLGLNGIFAETDEDFKVNC